MKVRWMIRRDFPEVLEIDQAAFGADDSWSESQWIAELKIKSTIAMVAERDNCITGFVVYDLARDRITLKRIAVHPDNAMQGVATQLVDSLKQKITLKRSRIETLVRDDNLVAHMFLRRVGFTCIAILKNLYESGDDGYVFSCDGQMARRVDAAHREHCG